MQSHLMNQKHGFILIGAILVLAVELTAPPTNSDGTKNFQAMEEASSMRRKQCRIEIHGWSDSNLQK